MNIAVSLDSFRGNWLFHRSVANRSRGGRGRTGAPFVPGVHPLTIHHVGVPANADTLQAPTASLAKGTVSNGIATVATHSQFDSALHTPPLLSNIVLSDTARIAASRMAVGSVWAGRLPHNASVASHSLAGRCTVGVESSYTMQRDELRKRKLMDIGLVAAWAAVLPVLLWAGHAAGF